MPLTIELRNALRKAIKQHVDDLIAQQVKPDTQSNQKWKITNYADWHYGHFVGMTQMNSKLIFFQFYHRDPDPEELREMSEIIEELGTPFRNYLHSIA